MEEILKLVTNYGFPVVVSLFFLLKMDNSLKELKDSIEKLTTKLHS